MSVNVLIGLPFYRGRNEIETTTSLIVSSLAMAKRGYELSLLPMVYGGIEDARNIIASFMLNRTKCTHLFMTDHDMGFAHTAVLKMFDSKAPVVACAAPLRKASGELVFNVDNYRQTEPGRGIADRVGGGLFLIAREALSALLGTGKIRTSNKESNYGTGYDGPVHGFFDRIPKGNEFIKEDFAFCERWRNLCSGEIVVISDEMIVHKGETKISGRLSDHLTVGINTNLAARPGAASA